MINLHRHTIFITFLSIFFVFSLIGMSKSSYATKLPGDTGEVTRLTPNMQANLPEAKFSIMPFSTSHFMVKRYNKSRLQNDKFPEIVRIGSKNKFKDTASLSYSTWGTTLGRHAYQFYVNRHTAPFGVFYDKAAVYNGHYIGIEIIFFPNEFRYSNGGHYGAIAISRNFARGFFYQHIYSGYVDYRFYVTKRSHGSTSRHPISIKNAVLSFGSLNGVNADEYNRHSWRAKEFLAGKKYYNMSGQKYPQRIYPYKYGNPSFNNANHVLNSGGVDGLTGEYVVYRNNGNNDKVYVTDDTGKGKEGKYIANKYFRGQHTITGTNIAEYRSIAAGQKVIGGRPNGAFPDTYGPGYLRINGKAHKPNPAFDWNSEFFLSKPYHQAGGGTYPYDNIFQFGSGEGSAWAILSSHKFYKNVRRHPYHPCVHVHYIDAKTGGTLREISVNKARLHEIMKNKKSQKKFKVNFNNYIQNWASYYKDGPNIGFKLAPASDLGHKAQIIAHDAQVNPWDGKEDWSQYYSGAKKQMVFPDATKKTQKTCHNLYVFLQPPKPTYRKPSGSQQGDVHKTLLARSHSGSNDFRVVKGYPSPNGSSNVNIPKDKVASTQYGSKKYAYLVWGTFPSKTHTIWITLPKLHHWSESYSYSYKIGKKTYYYSFHGDYWIERDFNFKFLDNPYKGANVMLHDNIGYSNSEGNYGSNDSYNPTDSSGRPNNKPYASITNISKMNYKYYPNVSEPDPNTDYKTSNQFNINLNQNNPDNKDKVSTYAGHKFAYLLNIQVGKNTARHENMLLPGISGSDNGDKAKCASWNDFGNNNSNFKWWNHAYMNWHLRDFSTTGNNSYVTTNNYLRSKADWALAAGQNHLKGAEDTADFNRKQQAYYDAHSNPSTELDFGETHSNYVPLQIPMIHYNVYHYNFGNGSQSKIPDNIVKNAGNNDTWHGNFEDKFINPTKTGRRRGWFMRDWGFGYAGQKVNVPIVPKIPNNAKKSSNDYSSDIANCGKGLNSSDLSTNPKSEINNYQFAYKESPKYRAPFEPIKVGTTGSMKPDINNSWKSHEQKFYKPYDKPQMALDIGRFIVDTGNVKTNNNPYSNDNGLRFWLEFQTKPTRWSPSYTGDKRDKLSGLRDDFLNTYVQVSITDPTDSNSNTKSLFTWKYRAYDGHDGDSNNVIAFRNGKPESRNVPAPLVGRAPYGNGLLHLKGNELTRYKKGEAIPLRVKISAIPINPVKPYADFWDPAHYSEGYIATDNKIQARDFTRPDVETANAQRSDGKGSADNANTMDHMKITGSSSNTNQTTSTHNTHYVKLVQPERTIKYFAGNIAGNSASWSKGARSSLKSLAAKNRVNNTEHDPAIRIQHEWLKVRQNNRRPYLVNMNTGKKHLIMVNQDTGVRDIVNINGRIINLSNDSTERKNLRKDHYAVVYPATFKTGYGIRPDITVSYGGNVSAPEYWNSGTRTDFAFPKEFGTNGGDYSADNQRSEMDNDMIVHRHGGPSDITHIGDNSHHHSIRSSEQERATAQKNHSANEPAAYITEAKQNKGNGSGSKYKPYRSEYNESSSNDEGDKAMENERYPQSTDSYDGNSAWPMARYIDKEFDMTLHSFYDTHTKEQYNTSGNDKMHPIPTEAGRGVMRYHFPAQDLSNNDGSGTDIAQDKDNRTNMITGFDKRGTAQKIYKLFTPAWLPLGNYQTVFERNLRTAKRLGGNWLDFEIGRPDTAVAHMMLSDTNPEDAHSSQFNDIYDKIRKKGKHGFADEQLRDELSLQPVMTRQITKYHSASDFPTSNKPMKDLIGANGWPWVGLQ